MNHDDKLIARCNHSATIKLCDNVMHDNIFDDSFWITCINQSKNGFCYSLTMGKKNDNSCKIINEFFSISLDKKKLLEQCFFF